HREVTAGLGLADGGRVTVGRGIGTATGTASGQDEAQAGRDGYRGEDAAARALLAWFQVHDNSPQWWMTRRFDVICRTSDCLEVWPSRAAHRPRFPPGESSPRAREDDLGSGPAQPAQGVAAADVLP